MRTYINKKNEIENSFYICRQRENSDCYILIVTGSTQWREVHTQQGQCQQCSHYTKCRFVLLYCFLEKHWAFRNNSMYENDGDDDDELSIVQQLHF